MIHDQTTKSAIAQDWAGVRKLCAGSHRQYQIGGVFINETPPDSFYNLPFLLAYAVLDQVLGELMDQRTFQCAKRKPLLGDKMVASRNHVPWQNYTLVETGKNARNDLAHEAKLVGKSDCFAFIDAIETELKSWGVI